MINGDGIHKQTGDYLAGAAHQLRAMQPSPGQPRSIGKGGRKQFWW